MSRPSHAVVRRRVPSDLPYCTAVLERTHRRDGYPRHWPRDPAGWLDPPELRDAWVAVLAGSVVGHVAVFEDAAAACAKLWAHRSGGAESEAAVVSRLYVDPDARGHQLGHRLMTAVVESARAEGLRPVLEVSSTDRAAIALYERLGWRSLGDTVEQWGSDTVTLRSFAWEPVA